MFITLAFKTLQLRLITVFSQVLGSMESHSLFHCNDIKLEPGFDIGGNNVEVEHMLNVRSSNYTKLEPGFYVTPRNNIQLESASEVSNCGVLIVGI